MKNELALMPETKSLAISSMEKNKKALSFDYDYHRLPVVDNNTKLIPIDECKAIIETLEKERNPAGETVEAVDIIKFMMSAFPQTDKTEKKLYMAHMVRVFAKYPASLHKRVAEQVVDTKKFRPSPADVLEIFDSHMEKWTYAQMIAKKHIDQHKKNNKQIEHKSKFTESQRLRQSEYMKELLGNHRKRENQENDD